MPMREVIQMFVAMYNMWYLRTDSFPMLYVACHDIGLQESSMPVSLVGLGKSAARDGLGWVGALSSSSSLLRFNILINMKVPPASLL